MAYDNICKYLAERFPRDLAIWATGAATGISVTEIGEAEVLKTELGIEPIRADSVILLQLLKSVLHLEFQLSVESQPPLPLRMLDYWVRLHRLYDAPIIQVIVMLRETPDDIPTEFRAANTWHRFHVVKLWEQDPEAFLHTPALLPLAVLTRAAQPRQLLKKVAEQVDQIESLAEQREISSCVQVMAGIRFEKELVRSMFREEIMEDSVIYQDIIQKGIQQGIQQGMKQADVSLVLRLLTHRFGPVDGPRKAAISGLSVPQLEQLGEDLLSFQTLADFDDWVTRNVA